MRSMCASLNLGLRFDDLQFLYATKALLLRGPLTFVLYMFYYLDD